MGREKLLFSPDKIRLAMKSSNFNFCGVRV